MNALLSTMRQTARLLRQPMAKQMAATGTSSPRWTPLQMAARLCSDRGSENRYDPYPQYETPSPYDKGYRDYRYGYKYKLYTGGVLPRPDEKKDRPLKMPPYKVWKKDQWTQRKALYGQNDYIDILGDGLVHPYMLMTGPQWLRAFKGNELQRLVRRIKYTGSKLRDMYPVKYQDMLKRIFFLYKRHNRKRRHAPYYGARRQTNRSRIDYHRYR